MRLTKKVIILVLVLMAISVFNLAAACSGVRLGVEVGNPNFVFIFRPSNFDFKLGYSMTENKNVFISADYRIVSGYPLVDFLHFFLGLGAYIQLYMEENPDEDFNLGGRIPLGLQIFLFGSAIEIFVEVCPTVTLVPEPGFDELMGYLGFTFLLR
jgi:hypothetical protein